MVFVLHEQENLWRINELMSDFFFFIITFSDEKELAKKEALKYMYLKFLKINAVLFIVLRTK